ncbi:MAG: cupin domain-containing protein [Elusimicrobiota bacterium]
MRAEQGRLTGVAARRFGALAVKQLTGRKGTDFSVLHIKMRPGSSAPLLHHARTDEFLLILKGSSYGRIGRRSVRLKAGDFAYMPAGTRHEFRAGPQGVEILDVFAPRLDLDAPDVVMAKGRQW